MLAGPASAQVSVPPLRSIRDAIAHRDSEPEATVAGRTTVGSGKLQADAFDVAMADATGGLRIFSRSAQPPVQEGDSIVATGSIKTYRGSVELAVTSMQVLPGARRMITPVDLPADAAQVGLHAGELVRVHGLTAGFGHSEGGQWLRLRDPASTDHAPITIWVAANHGAHIDLTAASKADTVVAVGIATSYQDNAEDPVVWQVVPRDATDITASAAETHARTWLLWAALGLLAAIGGGIALSRISARRQLHALQETEARYRQLLALLPDAVIVHSRGLILFTNPAAAELLGLPSETELVGRRLAEFAHPDSRMLFSDDPVQLEKDAASWSPRARAKMVTAAGSTVDVEIASSPCFYHDTPAMLLLARDITAQLRYERDLHALALVDELTGLHNRRAFTLFAEQELARARRNGRTPVLVFADLDGLKQINDQYGHAAGDAAIRLAGAALKGMLRETDLVARWSGDEFVALMVEGSEEAGQRIGGRLDAAIAAQAPPQMPYVVTASVGASALDPALPLRDAMERADANLYTQKKRHRRSKIRSTPTSVDVVRKES